MPPGRCASGFETTAEAATTAEDEAGTHLVALDVLRLVAVRQDPGGEVAERVYAVTQEGRRNATATRN